MRINLTIRVEEETVQLLDQWVRILREEIGPRNPERVWPRNRGRLLEEALRVWIDHMRFEEDREFQLYAETLPSVRANVLTQQRYYFGDYWRMLDEYNRSPSEG